MKNEKPELEVAACNYFLQSYNSFLKTNFSLIDHDDKPDIIIKDNNSGEVIGLEVTHLFYDTNEAKILLGRSLNIIHDPMNMYTLVQRLNDLLQKKTEAALKYSFAKRMFLLVRVASPIFFLSDFEIYEDEINIPMFNPFDQIWLLLFNDQSQKYEDIKPLQ